MVKRKGWRKESKRHAKAAKGIKTGRKKRCPGSRIRSKGLGRGLGIGGGRGPIGIPMNFGYIAQPLPEDVKDALYYLDLKKHPRFEKESERVLGIIEERNPKAVSRAKKMMMLNLRNFPK